MKRISSILDGIEKIYFDKQRGLKPLCIFLCGSHKQRILYNFTENKETEEYYPLIR